MNQEGKRLAEVVKRTHKKLRKRYRQGEDETIIWEDHIQHNKELQTYASAMHELATMHWESSRQVNTSRVLWTYSAIKQYFHKGEMHRLTEKEMRKLKHLELEEHCASSSWSEDSPRIKVLDVGSCYNPFATYKDLEVTAVDLCPASESVKQCDFLCLEVISREIRCPEDDIKHKEVLEDKTKSTSKSSLGINMKETENSNSECNHDVEPPLDSKETKDSENLLGQTKASLSDGSKSTCGNQIEKQNGNLGSKCVTALENGSFDVVIFCLFLEYIPSPKQRFQCCEKAYNLLRPNGILCIITPDSKHQNANVHIYKLWKITLGYLGFSRTKYEKQTHFHGMVFRKGLCKRAWELDAEREITVMKKTQVKSKFSSIDYEKVCGEIYIPQDFQDLSESEEEQERKSEIVCFE